MVENKIVYTNKLPFPVSAVFVAYIGKQGCACGCGGKYYYWNPEKFIGTDNEYRLSSKDTSVNRRMIKLVYNKVKKFGISEGIHILDNYIYSIERDNRAYRIYLHD